MIATRAMNNEEKHAAAELKKHGFHVFFQYSGKKGNYYATHTKLICQYFLSADGATDAINHLQSGILHKHNEKHLPLIINNKQINTMSETTNNLTLSAETTLQLKDQATYSELFNLAMLKFGKAKEVLSTKAAELQAITIVDDSTLAIAKDKVTEAKELRKKIEAKRVILKKPALDYGKAVDDAAKQLDGLINTQLKNVETTILAKLQEQEKKRMEEYAAAERKRQEAERQRQQEEERIKLIHADIREYGKRCIQELSDANSDDSLKDIFTNYVKNYDENRFKPLVNEAQEMIGVIREAGKCKRNIINLIAQQRASVVEAQRRQFQELIDKEKVKFYNISEQFNDVIKQQVVAVDAAVEVVVQKAEAKVAEAIDKQIDFEKQTSGLRKTWTWEVSDISNVPAKWLLVQPNKEVINEWLRARKDELNPDGEIIDGIRFYKKEGLSGK